MTGRPQTCISAGFLACIAGAMLALLFVAAQGEDGRVLTFGPVEPAPLGVFDRSPYNLALPIIGR